jgi:predicted phosphodiesterase
MKRIVSIGDIHGTKSWKDNFLIENGKVILQGPSIEKVIFVGDYVDSFSYTDIEIRENLLEIIDLKKRYPDQVVLLIGNHDIQYMNPSPKSRCSGFRSTMLHDLYDIFKENRSLFQFAHYESDVEGDQVLWTHAGVTNGWFGELLDSVRHKNYRFKDLFEEILNREYKIDEILNLAFDVNIDLIYNVDQESGGIDLNASPIWVRPKTLIEDPLFGYDQVVGHTPVMDIEIKFSKVETIYFIDTQEYGNKSILHFST